MAGFMPGFLCFKAWKELDMGQQLLIAFALVLIIEGILPFLNPKGMKQLMKTMSELDDQSLRISGFVSMILGLILLYIVN